MNTLVPMRRPNPSLHKYNNNSGFIREYEFLFGVTLSLLAWIVFAIYFGVIVLGVFAVVSLTGIGIGSFKHHRQSSLVLSCVPSIESQIHTDRESIRKAA